VKPAVDKGRGHTLQTLADEKLQWIYCSIFACIRRHESESSTAWISKGSNYLGLSGYRVPRHRGMEAGNRMGQCTDACNLQTKDITCGGLLNLRISSYFESCRMYFVLCS